MDYEKQQAALLALKDARSYVLDAHDRAQSRHDDIAGEEYMERVPWEEMMEAGVLLERIDDALFDLDAERDENH